MLMVCDECKKEVTVEGSVCITCDYYDERCDYCYYDETKTYRNPAEVRQCQGYSTTCECGETLEVKSNV